MHVEAFQHDTFPVEGVSSIVLSTPSRHIQELFIYIKVAKEGEEDKGDTTQRLDNPDAYRNLDDALCKPAFQHFKLTLRLSASPAVEVWRQRLLSLLPKSCALGRVQVRSIRTPHPIRRWMEERDGF